MKESTNLAPIIIRELGANRELVIASSSPFLDSRIVHESKV
jgi:hypothetical protein